MTKIMFSSCCFFYSRADTRSRQAPANRPLKGYRQPSGDVGLFVQQIGGPRLELSTGSDEVCFDATWHSARPTPSACSRGCVASCRAGGRLPGTPDGGIGAVVTTVAPIGRSRCDSELCSCARCRERRAVVVHREQGKPPTGLLAVGIVVQNEEFRRLRPPQRLSRTGSTRC
jgi:hypothetical protein